MKPIGVIVFILIFSGYIKAQSSFSLIFNSELHQTPGYMLELSNHTFLLSSFTSNTYDDSIYSIIYRIDENGILTDSIVVKNKVGDNYYRCINEVNDTLILISGSNNNNNNTNTLQLLAISPFLQSYWEKSYQLSGEFTSAVDALINQKSNLVMASSHAGVNCPICLSLLEVSFEGDSLRSNTIYSPNGVILFCDIKEDKLNRTYKLPVMGFPNSSGQILTIDTTLNLIGVDSIPEDANNSMTMKYDTDTSYFLIGKRWFPWTNTGDDIVMLHLDQNNDKIAVDISGKPNNIRDYAGYKQGLDFKFKTHIYAGGTSNQILDPYNFGNQDSWFILSRYDSALNLYWTKFYGGDAYYSLWGVTATDDKSCIMWGCRYDYRVQSFQQDIYILKVNEDGLYTNLEEPDIKAHDAIVYPNPGSEEVIVQSGPQIEGAVFTLFDMQGKVVLSQTIHSTEQHFDTKNLSSGTYPWRITFKNKVIENGKWIKR